MKGLRSVLQGLTIVALGAVGEAADVIVVVHPSSVVNPHRLPLERPARGLGPRTLTPGRTPGIGTESLTAALSDHSPEVLVSRSLSGLRRDDCFVVALHPSQLSQRGRVVGGLTVPGTGREVMVPDLQVFVAQPYSVWYCRDMETPPKQLGEGLLYGSESNLTGSGAAEHAYQFKVADPRLLARAAVEQALLGLPEDLASNALAPQLIDGAWSRRDGAAQLLERAQADTPITPSGRPWADTRARFRPTRVVPQPDGSVLVEVRLWNRLPSRACGYLTPSLPAGFGPGEPPRSGDNRFDLEPGQRAGMAFRLRPGPGTSVQDLQAIAFEVGALRLGRRELEGPRFPDGRRINPFLRDQDARR